MTSIPAAPSSVVAVRNSDSQATVSWVDNATGGAPYTSLTVQQRYGTGIESHSDWVVVANPTGTATNQVITGLSPNLYYQFQVRANNSVGSSGWQPVSGGGTNVYMTPGAPTGATAATAGSTVVVNWTNNSYVDEGNYFLVQRSVGGGAYTTVASALSYDATTWTDPSPSVVSTNQYQIAAYRTTPDALQSSWATTNLVGTISAPMAPTKLAPNGTPVDFTAINTFTWQHNPGTDGSAQTHFSIQTSTNGGSTWTALVTDVASSASSYAVPAATFTNGTTLLWQVQTEGSTGATPVHSPWSASATVTGYAIPVGALVTPVDGSSIYVGPLSFSWTYNQDQGLTQANWSCALYDSTGTTLLQTVTGTGTGTSGSFTYPVVDGVTYKIILTVQSTSRQFSNPSTVSVTIHFLPPVPVSITPTYFPCNGTMQLELIASAPASGTTVAVDHVSVQRRINGGDWITVANSIDMSVVKDLFYIDPLPITHGLNEYRVIAVSATPSYRVGNPVPITTSDGDTPGDGVWAFLNYGPNFTTLLRYHGDPTIAIKTARNKAAQPLLGLEFPIILQGTNVTRELTLTGSLYYSDDCIPFDLNNCVFDSSTDDWNTAGEEAGLVCFRDYRGRRYFGMLGDVITTDGLANAQSSSSYIPARRNLSSLQYSVSETYFNENLASTDVTAAEGGH